MLESLRFLILLTAFVSACEAQPPVADEAPEPAAATLEAPVEAPQATRLDPVGAPVVAPVKAPLEERLRDGRLDVEKVAAPEAARVRQPEVGPLLDRNGRVVR